MKMKYINYIVDAIIKLHPKYQLKNPVMFVVYVGAIFTLLIAFGLIRDDASESTQFVASISIWLWLTVIFANISESIAEGRGKAQASSLRNVKKNLTAKLLHGPKETGKYEQVSADSLKIGDTIIVEAGDVIPMDGDVIQGAASVDESAITGESAPVIRESGGDRTSVTGGTTVLSDWLAVRITTNPGESFVDKMIKLVEGASRKKTPNEIALSILLASLTLVFLLVCVCILPMSIYSVHVNGAGSPLSISVIIALLVCLAPTTIGALISAIGVAGMERLLKKNILAMSGRAVEAAGDIDVLMLDKTGTITYGNRQAKKLHCADGVSEHDLFVASYLSSLADETPEGRSVIKLVENTIDIKSICKEINLAEAISIPFSAQTRLSGLDTSKGSYRKGSGDMVKKLALENGLKWPQSLQIIVDSVSRSGATPLVVSLDNRPLGVIELKDVVKPGIAVRFSQLRKMGIKTVMITGDNPLTAASIAAEAGVDDYLAEATPEAKMRLIKDYQVQGKLVAMTGDGTNDAPALAQADVAVAMNSGTQAAKEAANMIDLDSDPTKLIEIVETGKQLLMTRGALTTFSLANDLAKYFAIIPAAFAGTYPILKALDIMKLHSPQSAILSAVIFNAVIILCLIPLALKGVKYKPLGAAVVLKNNLFVYGFGGVVIPFVGIKFIDILLTQLIS